MSLAQTAKKHATTIVLSALALAACAVVFVIDRGAVTTEEAEARKKNILPAWRPDEIESVTIERGGKTGKLTRLPPDARGQRFWQITLGDKSFPTEEQRVDQLLGTLEFATYERALAKDTVDVPALGVDAPRLRFTVVMSGRTTTVAVGGPASFPAGTTNVEVRAGDDRSFAVINAQLVAALDLDPETLRARRLAPYTSTEISRLEVDLPSGSFHLVRAEDRPDEMRLAGPANDAGKRAARGATDDLFAALGRAEAESFLPDDVAAKASSPALTLTFVPKDTSSPKGVLALGGACPDKPEEIVAILRAPSVVSACVPKALLESLSKPADTFVDRGPFFATLDEVHDITITTPERRLELARRGTGFHQRSPEDRELEGGTGRAILEPILALRAASFITGKEKAALGLDPARATVKLTSLLPAQDEDGGDKERVEELRVGEVDGETLPVLRVSDGAILALPASAKSALVPGKSALRSPTLVDAPETAITALRVKQGEKSQSIERTEQGGWKLLEPQGPGLSADIGLGADLATSLLPLKTDRFVADKDDGSFGLDKPRLIIEADLGAKPDAGGAKTVRLLIGAPTPTGAFAKLADDDVVFTIDRRLETAASQWLLDRSVFSLDLGDIVKVTISYADPKKKNLVLERKSGGLLVLASDPTNTTRAAAIRDALVELAPEGAVSVGPPRKEQGLDPAAVTITIEREPLDPPSKEGPPRIDPARTVKIRLGARDSFQGASITYARRDGVDATYAIANAKTKAFE